MPNISVTKTVLKKFYNHHKIIIHIFFGLIISGYIFNIITPKNIFFLTGEYIFSFDYFGHVANIIADYTKESSTKIDNTNCFDCPDFYHYSRWYSLFKIGYLSLSQILLLHPFVFLLLSMVITQLGALYFFTRLFFKNFSWIPFLISAFVFILYPYKYSLFVETYDGLMYTNMLVYFSVIIWTFKNIDKLTVKKSLLLGFITGVIFSFFFNISIAFFPIVFYATIILAIVYKKNLFINIKAIFTYVIFFLIPSIGINIPLFESLLNIGVSRHYIGYLSYNFTDSALAGLNLAQAEWFLILLFAGLFILSFFYSPIKFKNKVVLLFIYIIIVFIVMGVNSPVNIYGLIFETFPLMDSLQATHRFLFFEFIIFFTIMYLSLSRLEKERGIKKILFFLMSCLFILLPIYHIITKSNYFLIGQLPQEYFETQKYLNHISDEKIYFPPKTNLLHNIATDYGWADAQYNQSILLYKNPFTSLLPIRSLIQFERFPYLLSPRYLELFYLTNLTLPAEEIIKAMQIRGVNYIILDKNYKWKENYPNFDVDGFIKLTDIHKRFGNIYVLRLKTLNDTCQNSYGTISLEYCTSLDNPSKFFDKTKEEYLLEVFPRKIGEELQIRHNSLYIKNILDPILHQSFIDNRILFNKNIMQVSGNQKKVFYTKPLKKGKYILYISIFKYSKDMKIMGDAALAVRMPKKTIKKISPYEEKPGIYWEKINVQVNDKDTITIDIDNMGYVIVGSTPVLKAL